MLGVHGMCLKKRDSCTPSKVMFNKESWIEKQQLLLTGDEKRDIKPKRKYLHFDNRVSLISPEIQSYIFDKDRVSRHSFFPFIRYIKKTRKLKKNGGIKVKPRPISYASHLDSLIYSWYAFQLNELYEKTLVKEGLSNSVLAYRSGNGSNIDHACRTFRSVQDLEGSHVICIDIKSFFDNLDHLLLKKKWLQLLQLEDASLNELPQDHYVIYRAITKYSHISIDAVYKALGLDPKKPKPKEKSKLCTVKDFRSKLVKQGLVQRNKRDSGIGIPQGSSMSAILANMYMLDFDILANEQAKKWKGLYCRYSDDVLFAVPLSIAPEDVESFVRQQVMLTALSIGEDKTEKYIFQYEKGLMISRNIKTGYKKSLDYLGLSFDGRRILMKHASLAGYQRKVVASVKNVLRRKYRQNIEMPKRMLYERYTKMGKSNYQSYVNRCVQGLKDYGFSSIYLKKQASDFFVHKTVKRLDSVIRSKVLSKQRRRRVRSNCV